MANLPSYKIMYQKLKEDIDNNVYPIGTYLPTEGELEKLFQVSRTTVRHAVDLLAREGRVHVKQGAGTQVLDATEKQLPIYSKFHNISDVKFQRERPLRQTESGSIGSPPPHTWQAHSRWMRMIPFSVCSGSYTAARPPWL